MSLTVSRWRICPTRVVRSVSLRSRHRFLGSEQDSLTFLSSTVYHIHQKPVPKDGNCTDTEAHLDPFERGETPACDPDLPQTCQVGDLAGKHGAIVTTQGDTTFSTTYTDDFTAVRNQISVRLCPLLFPLFFPLRKCNNFIFNFFGLGSFPSYVRGTP